MSATAAVAELPASKPTAKFCETYLRGRLVAAKRPNGNGQFWQSLMIMPAPDAYSSPATVELLSTKRLGERDEEITVKVRIGGYRRSYKATDRETGQTTNVQTADNKLFVVED